jgi:cytidine deaminase
MTDAATIAKELRRLLANAHAPYSGVHVAAAVESPDGTVHYGVNVENAAYPQGVCAEASAISGAVTDGRKSIARVYVASSLPELVWPCGGCRQKIFEFSTEGCEIVSLAPGGEVGRQTIEQLLPLGFRLNTTQVHPE